MPEMIKRSQMAEYINTTPKAQQPKWDRIGFGVEGKNTDYSPEFDERQFIDADAPDSSLKRYGHTSDFDIIAAKDSPVFEFLDTLRVTRATYGDAETQHVEVRLYEPIDGEESTFAATLTNISIAVNSIGDSAEDPLTLATTANGKGDPVQGKFNYTSKTFTPDE